MQGATAVPAAGGEEEQRQRGLIPRTLEHLFGRIAELSGSVHSLAVGAAPMCMVGDRIRVPVLVH